MSSGLGMGGEGSRESSSRRGFRNHSWRCYLESQEGRDVRKMYDNNSARKGTRRGCQGGEKQKKKKERGQGR